MSPYRSVKYALGGAPRNRQDCIDYARKYGVRRIIAELRAKEEVNEQWTRIELYVIYIWVFNDRAVTYNDGIGACYRHEDEERQTLSISNANERFVRDVSYIQAEVEPHASDDFSFDGADKNFPHSIIEGNHD